jgi:hypothetical protein
MEPEYLGAEHIRAIVLEELITQTLLRYLDLGKHVLWLQNHPESGIIEGHSLLKEVVLNECVHLRVLSLATLVERS